jgi:ABC-type lipoprotein export system ATPase subunit
MRPAVEVEDVFRVYATDEGTAAALQGLSLTVHEGEVVAVLGPSGSGKTTLLRILAGLDRPSAGRVRVAGVDLRRLRGRGLDRYRSRQLGYADQRYTQALAPELTAGELVALRLALAGESPREQRRRTAELLGQVGLADRADTYPHELSGGEQQRVALCAALAHRPRLLLADEPTGELDAKNAAVVYELIGELARAQGTTAIVVSHDPGSASITGLSAQIRSGRLTVVTGPSGSGKTTLLHLLAGLDLPSAGEVLVLGERLDELDRAHRAAFRRDRLALVAQEPPLVPFLSVRENVELFLGLRGLDGSNGEAQETLAVVGLEQLTEQRVSRLSTGEQERVAIARALASEPDLLLADEPTARLDYANALAIGELLSRIARERGIAVLCATHDPAVIEQADAELSLA